MSSTRWRLFRLIVIQKNCAAKHRYRNPLKEKTKLLESDQMLPKWVTAHHSLTDLLYCIDLFSCIAASLFNKLTYLLTYLLKCVYRDCIVSNRQLSSFNGLIISTGIDGQNVHCVLELRLVHSSLTKVNWRSRTPPVLTASLECACWELSDLLSLQCM